MSDYVSVNGQVVPYDEARIAPGDAGMLHGAGLFETMRSRNGRIFRLAQHLERITRSAQVLGIGFSLSATQLAEMAEELLEANTLGETDARLRLTLTRGDLQDVSAESPVPPITLMLSATPLNPYPGEVYEKGATVIVSQYRQNPENPLCGHKSTSYFDRLLALREAHSAQAIEALWFTAHTNFLAEGSISNVFMVDKDGHIATPPLTVPEKTNQRLCLPGITRQVVIELATQQNMLVHERLLTIDDLLGAREVFLTNAVMGVMPVTHIEKHVVGDERPGALAGQFRQGYEQLISAGNS